MVADMATNMDLHMVADMEVDKVADMVANMFFDTKIGCTQFDDTGVG